MSLSTKIEILIQKLRDSDVWRSLFRLGGAVPKTRRDRIFAVMNNVFLHLHPAKMQLHSIKLKYTWGMGVIVFYLFMVLTVTGILLMFYYRPTVEFAYNDVLDLTEQVPLGILREIHRWAAHLMIVTIWLHMFRVFMTGSYKTPREFNWAVGVILLVLTMFLSFTGYLLPWDQLAIWAITVGANMGGASPFMGAEGAGSLFVKIGDINFVHKGADVKFGLLGGRFVGEAALLRFYVLHCVAVPFITTLLIAIHFWRVRKDGGISAPPER